MASLKLPVKGHCICKTIEYTLNATPIFTNCCHCRDCQNLSGSAFAINLMVEASNVSVTSETQPVTKSDERPGKEGSTAKSLHCPKCGAMLFATHGSFGDGFVFVRAGTLEESDKFSPNSHFFVRSKHPWITIPEGVRSFETLPGPNDGSLFDGEAKARVAAVSEASS